MDYQTIKIGTRDVTVEWKYVTVNAGEPKPTPASGYTMSEKLAIVDPVHDWYMEYREVEGEIVPI